MFGFSTTENINPNNDLMSSECPNNLSSVSLNNNFVSAASWEGDMCIWNIENNTLQVKAKTKFNAPVMDSDWAGNYIVGAFADKNAWLWDPVTNQRKQFGQHNAPVSKIVTCKDNQSMVITGSWDCSVKFWDMRKQGENLTIDTKERVYAMDCKSFVVAVAVAEKGVFIFDTRRPNTPVKTYVSPLRMQTRCISLFPKLDGVSLGSIEGRISVHYFQNESQSFNFKSNREKVMGQNDVAHAINSIQLHPKHETLLACGSDGQILLWDKVAKQKIRAYEKLPESIIDASFNNQGNLFGYVTGNDYGKGNDGKTHTSKLYVRSVSDMEMKPK